MSGDSEHSALSSSLTDMMTSLMVIFVLLLVNYLGNRQDEIQIARSKTDEMQEKLTTKLKDALVEGVEVKKLDNYNLVVIVPEDKLQFETGKNELNDSATEFLSKFVPALLDIYVAFEDDVSLINVEGHSDNKLRKDAANEYYNWDLSQERASAVMKFIFNLRKGSLENEKFKSIALFGGRGPIECQYPEQADELLRKTCRTVKFKIRLKSSEEAKA
jgi:flagellar motor protein MotB